jgi:hypothetical protein
MMEHLTPVARLSGEAVVIRGRKVWRTTAESPLDGLPIGGIKVVPQGEIEIVKPPSAPTHQVKVNPAESVTGLQVTEFEATLPLEIYGELFKDGR